MIIDKERINDFSSSCLGIKLFDYQIDFISDCFEKKYVLAVWSRQLGKSTTCSLFACLYAILNPNQTIIVIAHSERQSREIYRKILNFAHKVKEFKSSISKETQDETIFLNGSRILNLPCGDDGSYIRGFSANVVILDECAYIKDEIVSDVISPFLATKKEGKMIKLSTPRGKQGHFYKSYLSPIYSVHRYDYNYGIKSGLISEDYILQKKEEMTSLSFAQEYEARFIDEASSYFPSALINDNAENYFLYDLVSEVPKGSYYLGVDPARMGLDKSAFIVVQRGNEETPHRVVFVYSISKSKLDSLGDFVKRIHSKFKFKKIVIDETGLGSGLTDYLFRDLKEIVQGVCFTNKSKIDIYSSLRNNFENNRLIIPNHSELISELKDLQYEYTNSGTLKIFHPSNRHDDFADALALACYYIRHRELVFDFL